MDMYDILKVKPSDDDFKNPGDRTICFSKGKPSLIIGFLVEDFKDYCLSDDQFHKFNGKHYELVDDQEIGKKIYNWFINKGIASRWSLAKERELMTLLHYTDSIKKVAMDDDELLLNLNNGVLNIETLEFKSHSPNYYFSYVLNVDYDPSAQDCPNFLNFLSGCFAKSGNWEEGYKTDEVISMRGIGVPESRKCNACGAYHPGPWNESCPSARAKSEELKPIMEFNEWALQTLPSLKNSKSLIEAMKKLVALKGEKKK